MKSRSIANDPHHADTDLRNDALLNRVYMELKAARKGRDAVLLVGLVVMAAAAIYAEQTAGLPNWVNGALFALTLVLLAAFLVWTLKRQQAVADRNGLTCTNCGYRPAAHLVLSAATTQRCARCSSTLPKFLSGKS